MLSCSVPSSFGISVATGPLSVSAGTGVGVGEGEAMLPADLPLSCLCRRAGLGLVLPRCCSVGPSVSRRPVGSSAGGWKNSMSASKIRQLYTQIHIILH